jgi:peroxiredoxin
VLHLLGHVPTHQLALVVELVLGRYRPMKINGTKSDLTFVFALLALSLGINVYLALRVYAPGPAELRLLSKGEKVPAFAARRLAGGTVTLSYDSKPTVLYVFTPGCSWCRRNLANVKTLFEAKSGEFRFVGLALDDMGLEAYVAQEKIPFPVYSNVSEDTRAQYRLGGVPQTLVISSRGIVLENWSGAYDGKLRHDVEEFFSVSLPGLTPPEGAVTVASGRETPLH